MKVLKSLVSTSIAILCLAISITSCKKKDPQPKPIALDGKWTGVYNVTNDPTPYFLAFNFNADGTLTVYDDQVNPNTSSGTGTWELSGNTLNGTFLITLNPNTVYAFTANYDSKTGEITAGTWGFSPNTTGQATWSMTKQ